MILSEALSNGKVLTVILEVVLNFGHWFLSCRVDNNNLGTCFLWISWWYLYLHVSETRKRLPVFPLWCLEPHYNCVHHKHWRQTAGMRLAGEVWAKPPQTYQYASAATLNERRNPVPMEMSISIGGRGCNVDNNYRLYGPWWYHRLQNRQYQDSERFDEKYSGVKEISARNFSIH